MLEIEAPLYKEAPLHANTSNLDLCPCQCCDSDTVLTPSVRRRHSEDEPAYTVDESMTLDFHLATGAVADYPWGSMVARFTPQAPVTTESLPQVLAAHSVATAPWGSGAGFRESVGLYHEVVHYLQDGLTGIGHWDYLIRRRYYPQLLGLARNLSHDSALRVPYTTGPGAQLVRRMVEELVFVPTKRLSPERQTQLASALGALPFKQVDPSIRVEAPFLIENILEGEAVATVASFLLDLQMTEEQGEIATMHRDLFAPDEMTPPYWATWSFVRDSLGATFFGGDSQQSLGKLRVGYELLAFFVDLACAYPTPEQLKAKGLTRTDCEPGVKLARLFWSFLNLDDTDTKMFLNSLFRNGDPGRAEALVLSRTAFPYPSSTEVYEQWAGLFAGLLKKDDDRTLRIRLLACLRRLWRSKQCYYKHLMNVVDLKLPIFFMTSNGVSSYAFLFDHVEPKERGKLMADLLRQNRDIALVDFFFHEGRFSCPLAEAQVCSAATDDCRGKIASVDDLPQSPACLVRNGLHAAGWRFRPD